MSQPRYNDDQWTTVIRPLYPWFNLNLRELWEYRDLVLVFVRRDFVAQYKQTVLGPLWFFLTPLCTTLVLTVVFGKVVRIPTDGIPEFLFFLSGTVCWSYFSGCLVETSNTFAGNAHIFGKVYFPRLAVPVSIVISNLFKFLIQFGLFIGFFVYFYLKGAAIGPTLWIIGFPLCVLQMALFSLGCGILVSSMITKYRDLSIVVGFSMQLWMYATPVVYPLSQIPAQYRAIYMLNPVAGIVETFRMAFLGKSALEFQYVLLSWIITLIVLFLGLLFFSRIEKTSMDTI